MEVTDLPHYKRKTTALLCMVMGLFLSIGSFLHYQSSKDYQPRPRQVFLDVYNRPIGQQNLLTDTFHNPQYRVSKREKNGLNGDTPEDFLKEGILDLFTYDKDDLLSGRVYRKFEQWCSRYEAQDLYTNSFANLSQLKIVEAQNGLVRAKIVGDLKYIGSARRPYEGDVGLRLTAKTHKFEGNVVITAYGENKYPTVYKLTALVQRALIQDKAKGYQIVELELR